MAPGLFNGRCKLHGGLTPGGWGGRNQPTILERSLRAGTTIPLLDDEDEAAYKAIMAGWDDEGDRLNRIVINSRLAAARVTRAFAAGRMTEERCHELLGRWSEQERKAVEGIKAHAAPQSAVTEITAILPPEGEAEVEPGEPEDDAGDSEA